MTSLKESPSSDVIGYFYLSFSVSFSLSVNTPFEVKGHVRFLVAAGGAVILAAGARTFPSAPGLPPADPLPRSAPPRASTGS